MKLNEYIRLACEKHGYGYYQASDGVYYLTGFKVKQTLKHDSEKQETVSA